MPRTETNYRDEAISDARATAENFLDEIVEKLIDSGEASDDLLHDYPGGDSYHHETHVDKTYSLQEAADLLEQFAQYEEDNSGLWEGLTPREAIGVQAAYTYGGAVLSWFSRLIRGINGSGEIESLLERYHEAPEDALDLLTTHREDVPPGNPDEKTEKLQGVILGSLREAVQREIDTF